MDMMAGPGAAILSQQVTLVMELHMNEQSHRKCWISKEFVEQTYHISIKLLIYKTFPYPRNKFSFYLRHYILGLCDSQ